MIRTLHTCALDNATLRAARALLEDAFDGELTPEDWEHCLGGMHALAWDGDELVGHAAVVQRSIAHNGRPLRAGYVEGVAVRADRRRQGIAGELMGELEEIIRRAHDFGALGSSDEGLPFYTARGWKPWRGALRILTPDGVEDTPDELGWILVFGGELDLDGELLCADWRDGDVW
ncbi:GNAT family N-acetyltransferase [Solirubrobacter sp. CPCC 204708]|uniref:GNAT family N-acetyltransferase n=1 Tax=Solirubrobacter deserti TaxID=2282478 RepID=A0ABT4RF17_9ACTN|nr:GNAT family N-acetyltransferase [Solirubrobacter deserti]MBE2318649.1 GNAT family N-acetyltransferase [Solirubrobacter deserti]MDA0137107.1 GNAT family N-acetyltransferase [Solirubrobacter deserti]